MMTDPIADMLTRIRNAVSAKHARVLVPQSRVKMEIARILKEEGYIDNVEPVETDGRPFLALSLRYGPEGERVITGIERVSRSGLRVYVGKDDIPSILAGLGICIISTPQGLMTDSESRQRGLGGEIVCNVW